MTKQKIFIHIGLGKTATTTIQYLLHNNNFDNIYVPKTGLNIKYLQHWDLINNNLWSDLLAEISQIKNKNFVISSETFIYSKMNSVEYLDMIKLIFADYDIFIIYSIRNLKELMISSYLQHIKDLLILKENIPKEYWGFDKWIEWQLMNIKGFNFYHLIANFQNSIGLENIITLKYSKRIVNDFFKIFDIDIDTLEEKCEQKLNKSLVFNDHQKIINKLIKFENKLTNVEMFFLKKNIEFIIHENNKKQIINDYDDIILEFINKIYDDLIIFCSDYKIELEYITNIDKNNKY